MEITALLSSVATVLSFAMYIGIVVWASSPRRKRAFDAAARAPFALPDDEDSSGRGRGCEGREP